MLLNGTPVDLEHLKALGLVNYGHFTSMRVDDGKVRGLGLHLDRLSRDCRALFGADLDHGHLRQLLRQAIGHGAGSMVLRVTIYDPALELGHPSVAKQPHVLITMRDAIARPLPPMTLKSVSYERDLPAVKHVGLFGSIYHRRMAQLAGFDDVLFTDSRGVISEGATSNIGFIAGSEIIWPDAPALPGVTLELLRRLRPSTMATINIVDVSHFDGAFITNAAVGVRAVRRIDDTQWAGPAPIVEELAKAYTDLPGDPL